ncbi:uncharacterized protein LOC124257159 [Haliotis rubra]|uniref:uncharacterized protein LOC124257159 n=1 Tax=Haliotis rubra TaxID=36100 RepID=UPI001EE50507|nr:uncharacterized protein LOC124257159 [Haliotis rubra]
MTRLGAPFRILCPSGNSLVALSSVHSSWAEDRIWDFRCAQTDTTEECEWNTDVNELDEPMLFQCGDNGVVRGITSYFSPMNRDRRFSFLCCKIRDSFLTSCEFVDFLNDYDGGLNFIAPPGQVIKGVFSLHDNEMEDRIWRVEVCEVRKEIPAVPSISDSSAASTPSQSGGSLDLQANEILSNFPPPSALPQNGASPAGTTNQIQPVSGTTNQVQQVSGTANQMQSNQANFQNAATSSSQMNSVIGGNSNQNAVQGNRMQSTFQQQRSPQGQGNRLNQQTQRNGMVTGLNPNQNRFMPNQQLMAMGRFPGIQPNLNGMFFSG